MLQIMIIHKEVIMLTFHQRANASVFRFVMIILTVCLALSAAACGGPDDNVPPGTEDETTTPAESTAIDYSQMKIAGPVVEFFADDHTVGTYFTDYDWYQDNMLCIIIDNYDDLCELYVAANLHYRSCIINRSILEIEQKNIYTEDFFKDGYLIAVVTIDLSTNFTYEFEVETMGEDINIMATVTEPAVQPTMNGGYINLIPMEGKYNGEKIEVTFERIDEESQPGS